MFFFGEDLSFGESPFGNVVEEIVNVNVPRFRDFGRNENADNSNKVEIFTRKRVFFVLEIRV
jgi:hypothetical protein